MYKLLVDGAERKNKSIKLLKDDEIVDEITGDIDLVLNIKNILFKNNLILNDIQKVDFNRGPGSFTGLKIAATITNTLNWALGRINPSEQVMPEYGKEPNIQPNSA